MEQAEIQRRITNILDMYYDGVIFNQEAHQALLAAINNWYLSTGVPYVVDEAIPHTVEEYIG